MRIRMMQWAAVVGLAFTGQSCRTVLARLPFVSRERVAAPVTEDQASRILSRTRELLARGDARGARRTIRPLLGDVRYSREVTPLLAKIAEVSAGGAAAAATSEPAAGEAAPAATLPDRERAEALKEADRRLRKAELLAGRQKYSQAQEVLAPLLDANLYPDRVKALERTINRGRIQQAIEIAKKRSAQRALGEVEDRWVLPKNYGQTISITRNLGPMALPPGPMEKLVNQKVSMNLTNAGVKDLVMALSKIDGLNIIADEALQAKKKLTISIRNVPLKELLSYIARNMGIAFYVGENTIWVTAGEDNGGGPKLETRIYKIRTGFTPILKGDQGGAGGGGGHGTALKLGKVQNSEDTELEDVLDAFLNDNPPDGALYKIFPERNLLIVRNTLANLRVVEQLLAEFDQAPLQVLIEARFVTISDSDLREIGLDIPDFSLDRGASNKSVIKTLKGVTKFKDFKNAANGANITVSGILGNHTYQAILHLLREQSSTRTLSAPRITVVNNHTARIRKGDTLYYFEDYDLESVDMGNGGTRTQLVPSGSPTELDLGISLTVKPSIGNDGKTIQLALQPNIVQFLEWLNFQTSGNNGSGNSGTTTTTGASDQPGGMVSLPKINVSTLQTSVVVNSGDTVVLGGTLESKNNKTVRKVPILGDIPYLGVLFRHTETEEEPRHLLIFVTATIIGSSGEFINYENQSGTAAAK